MKIQNIKGGAFFLATAPYNWNSVTISDIGFYGPLKVLANSSKYFTGYYPDFFYVQGSKFRKLTKAELKDTFKNALEMDPKFFTAAEKKTLGSVFKINVEKYLSESKSCTRVKGYKKPTTNKRVKTYARKRAK